MPSKNACALANNSVVCLHMASDTCLCRQHWHASGRSHDDLDTAATGTDQAPNSKARHSAAKPIAMSQMIDSFHDAPPPAPATSMAGCCYMMVHSFFFLSPFSGGRLSRTLSRRVQMVWKSGRSPGKGAQHCATRSFSSAGTFLPHLPSTEAMLSLLRSEVGYASRDKRLWH